VSSATATSPTASALPAGTWNVDRTHSSVGFAVKHMVVSTFRSHFDDFDASLTVTEDGGAALAGTVRAASIVVADDTLAAHLASPEFFDSERHPEIVFRATSIERDGDRLSVAGELTIKGITRAVAAVGTVTDAVEDLYGGSRVGIELETIVDRREFGLEWNAPLPKGGFAVANDVVLRINLELARA